MAHAQCMLHTKVKNLHWEYVTLNGFPLQQRLHERPSMLRYTYIACPVILNVRQLKMWRNVVRIVLQCLNEINLDRPLIKEHEHITIFNSWISTFNCRTVYLGNVWKWCIFNSRALWFCHQLWLFWWRLRNRSSEVCERTVSQSAILHLSSFSLVVQIVLPVDRLGLK
jgi:hypothetical protein